MNNTNTNDSSISIRDNNSQILSIIPNEWRIPLTIISYVKGYSGIDEYVLEMIRDRLAMFADSRDDLGEDFQEYVKDIEGITTEKEDEKKEESTTKEEVEEGFEEIEATLKLKKNVAEVLRIFARYYNGDRMGDLDKFISEEVNKIVPALAASVPIQEKFPDGLKQHIQDLLSNEANKDDNKNKKNLEDLK